MTTLHLNLRRKWFDMILSRVKKEEYRDIKVYWIKRVVKACVEKTEKVTFSNGYTWNRDQFVIELKRIYVGKGKEEWGAVPGKYYYIFELGNIISSNIKQKK